jgi:hypothetical protein
MTIHCTSLTVYFEGTANPLLGYKAGAFVNYVTQIGLFYDITKGVDLSTVKSKDQYPSFPARFKIGFDGCGVTNGMSGLIFADGLRSQCDDVKRHVCALLECGHTKIILNAVGLSRGAIAVLYLAQLLGDLDPAQVELNLLLFDPVPGNLISSSKFFDIFGASTANSSLDLTKCGNIGKVLALYPYEPLPDMAFHAPSLPNYPSSCEWVEDACLGCHQGALFCSGNLPSRLSYLQISEWLTDRGVAFDLTDKRKYDVVHGLRRPPDTCVDWMRDELLRMIKEERSMVRHAHSAPSGGTIVRREGKCLFLNKYHKKLSEQLDKPRPVQAPESRACEFMLEVQRPSGGSLLGSVFKSSSRSAAYEQR